MNKQYKQKDFQFAEDEIIYYTCSDCGYSCDSPKDGDEIIDNQLICPECGSTDIIAESSHEDMKCAICGKLFDFAEDCYSKIDENGDYINICIDCYSKLK